MALLLLLLCAMPSYGSGALQLPDTIAPEYAAYGEDEVEASPLISTDSLAALYPSSAAAVAFAALPDSVVPLLTQRMRLDMIDYAMAGQKRPQKNRLYGLSVLDTVTPVFLKAAITEVSDIQVGIYGGRGKDKGLVAVSYTVAPRDAAADSQLFFYDSGMKPLRTQKVFRQPRTEDFLILPPKSDVRLSELTGLIPFPTVTYALDPSEGTLTATLTVDALMTLESLDMLRPYLRPTVVYRWNGRRFEAVKRR